MKPMDIYNFPLQVGDKVRICTIEELIQRYPQHESSIRRCRTVGQIPCYFTSAMYNHCGEVITVSEIKDKTGIFLCKENSFWWDKTIVVPLKDYAIIQDIYLPYKYRAKRKE